MLMLHLVMSFYQYGKQSADEQDKETVYVKSENEKEFYCTCKKSCSDKNHSLKDTARSKNTCCARAQTTCPCVIALQDYKASAGIFLNNYMLLRPAVFILIKKHIELKHGGSMQQYIKRFDEYLLDLSVRYCSGRIRNSSGFL